MHSTAQVNRKRRRDEGPNPSMDRKEGDTTVGAGPSLGLEQEFPPDLIDEILCWSCEGRPSRALQLALVCRLWHDRVKAADRLWPLVVRRLQPKLMIAVRTATYSRVLESINAAKKLIPLKSSSLHPIEECTLEFGCPIYAEALGVVGPGVSYCSVCKENVYTVRTQAEMDDARQLRRCVQFSARDLAVDVEDNTIIRIAVILTSEESAMATARQIAASEVFDRQSPSIFPVLEVNSFFMPFLNICFFSSVAVDMMPPDAPVFAMIVTVAELVTKVRHASLPKPFELALCMGRVVGLEPNDFSDQLVAVLQSRYDRRERETLRGKR